MYVFAEKSRTVFKLRSLSFHWRVLLIGALLTAFHLASVQLYKRAYSLPSYEQTQRQYSLSVRALFAEPVSVNGPCCLDYLFANLTPSHDDRSLAACRRRLEHVTNGASDEYSLISALLSEPTDKAQSKTKAQIGVSIRAGVRRLDRILLAPSERRTRALNAVDDVINQRRRAGIRTLKKLEDFDGIDRISLGANDCSPGLGAELTAIIILISAPDDFDGRRELRATWGKSFENSQQNQTRLYFALGAIPYNHSRAAVQGRLEAEHKLYGDLIQFGFPDGYYELSIKSTAILRWLSVHCPLARIALKSDMDSFIDYGRFVPFCRSLIDRRIGERHYEIHGSLIFGSRVFRSTRSKWFTKTADFPSRTYPLYAGSSWLLAGPGLPFVLYRTALLHSLPALLWEDVWITGIVTAKLSSAGIGIKLLDCAGCLRYLIDDVKEKTALWLITQIPRVGHNQSYYVEELFGARL